ncbi:Double-strand break repair protein [Balamuthia mandrillaris]
MFAATDAAEEHRQEEEGGMQEQGEDCADPGPASADTLRFLVATDNHLGYAEKDPIRGDDSFNTFEEILQLAQFHKVDAVLLGGDLFHDNKPSRRTLFRTMHLLRKYCLGDNPISIQIVSDQSMNFHSGNGVNYEDPNFNVAIPVFSIHGNHDDPTGDGGLAALDLLSVANLVNYFGKSENVDDVTVYPILLTKGKTKVAIYGLGNIRDERLYRTFQQKKVKLMRPVESREEWFNMFVLHQNRVAHSQKNYIHECMLDNFLDFVIWGHEHECLITPQSSTVGDFYITQPGSSVATSLSEGESKKKHVGLLEICEDQFRLNAIPLKTVRPFLMEEVILREHDLDANDPEQVVEFLGDKVREMIARVSTEFPRDNRAPKLPLIRLRVEYGGFSTCNPQRFGQQFVGKVANPNDILLFYKRRTATPKQKEEGEAQTLLKAHRPEPLDDTRIEDLITSYLGISQKLEILPEHEFNIALHNFVEKDESKAIAEFVNKRLNDMQQFLVADDPKKTLETSYLQTLVTEQTDQLRVQHGSLESSELDEEIRKEEALKGEFPAKPKYSSDDEENEDDLLVASKQKHKSKAGSSVMPTAPNKRPQQVTKKSKAGSSSETTATTSSSSKGSKRAPAKKTRQKPGYALDITAKEELHSDDDFADVTINKGTNEANDSTSNNKGKRKRAVMKQEKQDSGILAIATSGSDAAASEQPATTSRPRQKRKTTTIAPATSLFSTSTNNVSILSLSLLLLSLELIPIHTRS